MKAEVNALTEPPQIDESPVASDITEAVSQRAYEIFESRGGEHGADLDDWLQAEHEISANGDRRKSYAK